VIQIDAVIPFTGSKIAIFFEQQLLIYKRDYSPGIPFQGMWDFPGGGREQEETPMECALRELEEEFALKLSHDRVGWIRYYPGHSNGSLVNYFMVARINSLELAAINFGDEGEYWKLMDIDEFLMREDAVPHLKVRLQNYLDVVRV